MRRALALRLLRSLLAIGLMLTGCPASAGAQPAAATDSTGALPAAVVLQQARELLSDGDYDRCIEILKPALEMARSDPSRLREVYLQLIKTYVFLGNDLKFKPQGREASSLNYQEARRLIAECLGTPGLRHTIPEPVSEFPPEMVMFFTETRRQAFGAFRVREVVPAGAVVLLDGDTLRALPGELQAGDVDIATGAHVVVVRAAGFKETSERIAIAPDVTLERSYRLTKRHGKSWYATRSGAALGLVGGLVAIVVSRGAASAATATPLPGAPDPPSSR